MVPADPAAGPILDSMDSCCVYRLCNGHVIGGRCNFLWFTTLVVGNKHSHGHNIDVRAGIRWFSIFLNLPLQFVGFVLGNPLEEPARNYVGSIQAGNILWDLHSPKLTMEPAEEALVQVPC